MTEKATYVVMKQCQAQLSDRTIVRLQPGEPFPPNAVIGNPKAWLNGGFIRRLDNQPDPTPPSSSLPSTPATPDDVKRSASKPPAPGEQIRTPLGGDGGVKPYEPPEMQAVSREQLLELTKQDLFDLAESAGVDMPKSITKQEMVERLVAGSG